MNRPPLRERIVGALALQPMTNGQLARCLSVTQQTANDALNRLCKRGCVRRHGWEKRPSGHPAQLFEVVG